MKCTVIASVLFVLAGSAARSGVVIEMETKDSQSKGEAATDTIYADGNMLRMESQDGGTTSMIFRDDRMLVCEHDKKRCQAIDERDIAELSEEIGGAMKQMKEELAKLPPEQRAMMEKMMQGRMPAGMGQEPAPRRIEKGAAEQIGDYSCVNRTLYSGDERVWEVCAGEEHAAPFAEALDAFRAMSDFTEQLRDVVMQSPLGSMIETPFMELEAIGGIPIRVRTFEHGQLQSESTLKSVTRRDLEPTLFEAPKGFKTKSLADEIKKGR
jgi:hypothetical protein